MEPVLKEYVKVEERIGDYEQASEDLSDEDQESVRAFLNDLCTERKLLDARIEQLRAKFEGLDDVKFNNHAKPEDFYHGQATQNPRISTRR